MACKLIEGKSLADINRLRLNEWEGDSKQKKPNDCQLVMICGNRDCIAREHMRVKSWESWEKKKGQPPTVPPPETVVSNWRLVQVAKSPWISLTEEENESVVRELIQRRKAKDES